MALVLHAVHVRELRLSLERHTYQRAKGPAYSRSVLAATRIVKPMIGEASNRWHDGHGACQIRSEVGLVDEVAGQPTASDQGSTNRPLAS